MTAAEWFADPADRILDSTIGGVLRDAAETATDQIALVDGDVDDDPRRWTYGELLAAAETVAAGLAARFDPGERLAVWLPTRPEALILTYAAALAGLVLVPVNPALRAAEVAHVLANSASVGLVSVPSHRGADLAGALASVRAGLPELREATWLDEVPATDPGGGRWSDLRGGAGVNLPVVDPDAVALLVYTSGTTGQPKGARLTHRGMTNASRFGAERFGLEPGDVYVDPLPMCHVGGQGVALELCQSQVTMVMLGTYDAARQLALIEREGASHTVGVPTMLRAVLADPTRSGRDLSSLRAISTGGAAVPAELVGEVRRELGAVVTVVFGQTECCGFVTQTFLDDADEIVAETLGRPLDGMDVRITDVETGAVVAHGEVGELEVRAVNTMAGYHELDEATAEAIRPGGWLRTGDLMTMDADGYLRIVGRRKELVITGGVNVYPAEIEAVIGGHPSVGAVAIVGLPDDRWGERVVAVLSAAPGAVVDAADVESYTKELLAAFKVPKQWVVVDELPMTALGKVQKHLVTELLG